MKILSDHRQAGNVAVGGIRNLARLGLSAVKACMQDPRRIALHKQTKTPRVSATNYNIGSYKL